MIVGDNKSKFLHFAKSIYDNYQLRIFTSLNWNFEYEII